MRLCVFGGRGNERGEEAINDFLPQQRKNEMGRRGWEESNELAFHYKNHKIVLMTKYWALSNKILDHITCIMEPHVGSHTVMQTNCAVPLCVPRIRPPPSPPRRACACLNVSACQVHLL